MRRLSDRREETHAGRIEPPIRRDPPMAALQLRAIF